MFFLSYVHFGTFYLENKKFLCKKYMECKSFDAQYLKTILFYFEKKKIRVLDKLLQILVTQNFDLHSGKFSESY